MSTDKTTKSAKASARGSTTAAVTATVTAKTNCTCNDGTRKIIYGTGSNCTNAYLDADVKAAQFCSTHGGVKSNAKAGCPV